MSIGIKVRRKRTSGTVVQTPFDAAIWITDQFACSSALGSYRLKTLGSGTSADWPNGRIAMPAVL